HISPADTSIIATADERLNWNHRRFLGCGAFSLMSCEPRGSGLWMQSRRGTEARSIGSQALEAMRIFHNKAVLIGHSQKLSLDLRRSNQTILLGAAYPDAGHHSQRSESSAWSLESHNIDHANYHIVTINSALQRPALKRRG